MVRLLINSRMVAIVPPVVWTEGRNTFAGDGESPVIYRPGDPQAGRVCCARTSEPTSRSQPENGALENPRPGQHRKGRPRMAARAAGLRSEERSRVYAHRMSNGKRKCTPERKNIDQQGGNLQLVHARHSRVAADILN